MSSGESSPPYEPNQPPTASTSVPNATKISLGIAHSSLVRELVGDGNSGSKCGRSRSIAMTGAARPAVGAPWARAGCRRRSPRPAPGRRRHRCRRSERPDPRGSGGGVDLERAGAIFAGSLRAPKARLLLAAALGAAPDPVIAIERLRPHLLPEFPSPTNSLTNEE